MNHYIEFVSNRHWREVIADEERKQDFTLCATASGHSFYVLTQTGTRDGDITHAVRTVAGNHQLPNRPQFYHRSI